MWSPPEGVADFTQVAVPGWSDRLANILAPVYIKHTTFNKLHNIKLISDAFYHLFLQKDYETLKSLICESSEVLCEAADASLRAQRICNNCEFYKPNFTCGKTVEDMLPWEDCNKWSKA